MPKSGLSPVQTRFAEKSRQKLTPGTGIEGCGYGISKPKFAFTATMSLALMAPEALLS